MPEIQIRSYHVIVEECHLDGLKTVSPPTRKAAAAVVFKNPYAGLYQEDLSLFYQWSEYLGGVLTQKAVADVKLIWKFMLKREEKYEYLNRVVDL
jgi:hypothetical protein